GGKTTYEKRTLAHPKDSCEEITQEQFQTFQKENAKHELEKTYYGHLTGGGWFRATLKKCFLSDGSTNKNYETLCPGQNCQIKEDKTERTFSEVKKIYGQQQKPSGIA